MRILVLGAGAVGGYFGGRLAEAGNDVTFLVRPPRREKLRSCGLRIVSGSGDWSGPVKAISKDEASDGFDVVFLTCKAYDLDAAIGDIGPFVGPDTAILPALNGIRHIGILQDAFGERNVLGGLVKIAATLDPEGAVRHLNDWEYITFGELDGVMSPRVVQLKNAFANTPIKASAVTDVLQAMWEKLVHLATVAGMTTLMRASVGEIARTQEGTKLFIDLLKTNAQIAAREGYRPPAKFMDEMHELFADRALPYTASMLRDIERGGPVEADHIVGFMRDKARAHGLQDLLLSVSYAHLQSYEQRRAAGRL